MPIKPENYIKVYGWMISELNLKGNEILVYAIIYGFTNSNAKSYSGSLQFLANWTNTSKQGIQKNLKSLTQKGYITKKEIFVNRIKYCEYRTTELMPDEKVEQGVQHSILLGCKHSLPNIDNNKNKKNI